MALPAPGLLSLLCLATTAPQPEAVMPDPQLAAGRFEASWQSLAQYTCPDWFRDAKFGIFMHWGVCEVAENNGWYGRWMYVPRGAPDWGSQTYAYHLEHFGHPSEFGYKDLIPRWTAEHWDPVALVQLYKRIGARYVVPVACHHDNFDCWDSTSQPWNSVNLGPHRDVIGEWKKAVEAAGLRLGVSDHSARAWSWFEPAHGSDPDGPKQGVPYDGNLTLADGQGQWWEGYDPQELYCRTHEPGAPPDAAYVEKWFRRTKELLDKYRPDLIYFDGGLPFGETGLRLMAHYYNANAARHAGRCEAVVNIKSTPDEGAVVLDIERGQSDRLREHPWQTDTTVNPGWFFQVGKLFLTARVVIHNLCDIVSKNGNMLLNVGLRADGTLPDDQRAVLEEVGRWLEINGEAICGTRPWRVYGEGPTQIEIGHFKERLEPYTAEDIRFTAKDGVLYAICLGWPGRAVTIKSVGADFGAIGTVRLLGLGGELKWHRDGRGLTVELPDRAPCDHAVVLKLSRG